MDIELQKEIRAMEKRLELKVTLCHTVVSHRLPLST